MAEDLKTATKEKNNLEEDNYTDIKTLHHDSEGPRDWKSIAEVRMVMYVVPVAIVFIIVAYILSHFMK